jgi:tetratricopeptide (TPR) repeat protein
MPLSSARATSASPRLCLAASALILVASLVQTPRARAAPGAPSPDKQARELFQKAEISFNLGKFVEALADYQAAYQAKPLAPFLFNVAQCYRNMQDYERARFFFRRYLALDPRTPNRRMVDDLISEMSGKLENGKNDGKTDATALALSVPAAGGASAMRDDAATRLNLSASAPASPTGLAIATDGGRAAPDARPPAIYKRWWFWAGVGALAVGATAVAIATARPGAPHGSLATIDGR